MKILDTIIDKGLMIAIRIGLGCYAVSVGTDKAAFQIVTIEQFFELITIVSFSTFSFGRAIYELLCLFRNEK